MTATPTTQPTQTTQLTDKEALLKIRRSLIKIDRVLKVTLDVQVSEQNKKTARNKQTRRVQNKQQQRRTKGLGIKEGIKNKFKSIAERLFDPVINFFVMTMIGWVATKLLPLMPQLIKVLKVLKPVGDVLAFVLRTILDITTSFIKIGYDTYDTVKKASDGIKKIPFKKEADTFISMFKNTIDTTVNKIYELANIQPPKQESQAQSNNHPKSQTQQPIKGAATGGQIMPTRGNVPVGGPITRGQKSSRPIPKKQINLQQGQIGQNVPGGEKAIRNFYRSPKTITASPTDKILEFFGFKNKLNNKTPVDSISNISKTLRRRNMIFGDLASIGSDVALGKKPNKKVYKNTAIDVLQLSALIADKQNAQMSEQLLAMAYGGVIPPRASNVGMKSNMVDLISTIIQRSVEERVNKALMEIKSAPDSGTPDKNVRQMKDWFQTLRDQIGGAAGNLAGGLQDFFRNIPSAIGDLLGQGEPVSKIEMGGFSESDILNLGKIVSAEAQGEGAVGQAAVLNVILNRYRLIKNGKAKPSDFGVRGKRADQVTVSDIIFARTPKGGYEFSPIGDGSFDKTSARTASKALEAALKNHGNNPAEFLKVLTKQGLSPQQAESIVRSTFFYNPQAASSVPMRGQPTTIFGRHGFQQSGNVNIRLTGPLAPPINARITPIEQVQLPPGTYRRVVRQFSEKQLLDPNGMFTSGFGPRMHPIRGVLIPHKGIDIAPPGKGYFVGINVKGTVDDVGIDDGGWGNYVIIKDEKGVQYLFGHLARIDPGIKKGKVYGGNGQIIGEIGRTGGSTGIHLHFERLVNVNGKMQAVDPTKYANLLSIGNKTVNYEHKPTVVSPNDPVSKQIAMLELHAGAPSDQTGIIHSLLDPENPLTSKIGNLYGRYPLGYRELGGPKRGLSLVELIAMDAKNTRDLLDPETRQGVIDREARRLFNILKQHPEIQVRLFAGHADVTSGESGTGGTRPGTNIGNQTLEQYFNTSVAARIAQLAKDNKMNNIMYITSRIANEKDDPNNNWNRAQSIRNALLQNTRQQTSGASTNQPLLERVLGLGWNKSFETIVNGRKLTYRRRTNFVSDVLEVIDSNGNIIKTEDWIKARDAMQTRVSPEAQVGRPSSSKPTGTPGRKPTGTPGRKPTGTPGRKPTKKPPNRAWWDPRRLFGMKKGGYIGKSPYISSGYASYDRPGGRVILAIQPITIAQPVPVDNPVPVPFPIAVSVNSTTLQRG